MDRQMSDVLGIGLDGVVLRESEFTVLKIPKLSGTAQPDGSIKPAEFFEVDKLGLDREKDVYDRLKGAPFVAECLGVSDFGITLKYYSGGSLEAYMRTHQEPSLQLKQRWITQVATALVHCHEARILVADIALRNLLIDEHLNMFMIDFSNSYIFEDDAVIADLRQEDYTPKMDMLYLGSVIYSIVKWCKYSLDCADESEWPSLPELPATKGIPFGHIIHCCWTGQYDHVTQLHQHVVSHRARNRSKRKSKRVVKARTEAEVNAI